MSGTMYFSVRVENLKNAEVEWLREALKRIDTSGYSREDRAALLKAQPWRNGGFSTSDGPFFFTEGLDNVLSPFLRVYNEQPIFCLPGNAADLLSAFLREFRPEETITLHWGHMPDQASDEHPDFRAGSYFITAVDVVVNDTMGWEKQQLADYKRAKNLASLKLN